MNRLWMIRVAGLLLILVLLLLLVNLHSRLQRLAGERGTVSATR
ncbi:MAG TPA: hypothetical protein VMT00_15025 [Thermoanaerobaculia bacterium]|nr:hypothetical protein [Thermoanaerobaculia bacterium]